EAARTCVRLSDLVERIGWETAKDQFPEVRRLLQEYGQTVREIDSDIWVRPVAEQMRQGTRLNMPCAVTDVRFINEVEALKSLGAVVVRVERPGSGLQGAAGQHASETELADLQADYTIENGGTLEDLAEQVRELVRKLS